MKSNFGRHEQWGNFRPHKPGSLESHRGFGSGFDPNEFCPCGFGSQGNKQQTKKKPEKVIEQIDEIQIQ